MIYQLGDTVCIKGSAFAGSDDPNDATYRGQTGELVTDLSEMLGEGWAGHWEVELADGEITLVTEDEIELAQD